MFPLLVFVFVCCYCFGLVFKKLFPLELFLLFIDVGHYNDNLDDYLQIAETINNAKLSNCDIRDGNTDVDESNVYHRIVISIGELDFGGRKGNDSKDLPSNDNNNNDNSSMNIAASQESGSLCINGYSLNELIGRGAYGSVYQAKKDKGETQYAVKEIDLESLQQDTHSQCLDTHSPSSPKEDQSSNCTTALFKEVSILRAMNHPNIVKVNRKNSAAMHESVIKKLLSFSSFR